MSDKQEILWRQILLAEQGGTSERAVWCHNLCCWLEPYTSPVGWPTPRYDDPAKCGDPGRMILEWSQGAESGSYWGVRANDWTPGRPWLEQPPAPCKLKSEAEAAWEKHCGAGQNPWLQNDKQAEQLFISGFNAGKGKP